jgi:methionyl-tRNA formyltransferase
MNILFFGSTSDSVIVLEKLFSLSEVSIAAVITQPPRPIGRKQIVTPTPVELWAKEKHITTLSFPSDDDKPSFYQSEETVVDTLEPFKADLIVSASYGQRIPTKTIEDAKYGGLNVHPSLLPRWRGADPVPLAILSGDHQIGVTVVTLSEAFDEGKIIAQKKIPILPTDYSDPLRAKLFGLGADLLAEVLPDYISGKIKGSPQHKSDTPFSKRLTREDGFEPWESIQKAFDDKEESLRLDRKFRAFDPWPGLWTNVVTKNGEKRLKVVKLHVEPTTSLLVLDEVQLEGKNAVSFEQFKKAYPAV